MKSLGRGILFWGTFLSIVAWMIVGGTGHRLLAIGWSVLNVALVVVCRRCLTLRDVQRYSAAKYFDKLFD